MPPRLVELKRQELNTWQMYLAQLRLQIAQQGGPTAPTSLLFQAEEIERTIRGIEGELSDLPPEGVGKTEQEVSTESQSASLLALVLRIASKQETHAQRLDDLELIARRVAIWFDPPPRLWGLRVASWALAIAAAYVIAIKEFREFVFDNLFSGIVIMVLLLALAVALQLLVRSLGDGHS